MFTKFYFILMLALTWLGFNEFSSYKFALYQIFITTAIIYFICKKLNLIPKKFSFKIKLITYIFWLIKEIFFSSLQIIKVIWTGSNYTGQIKWINTIQTEEIGRVVFANSITITPGTLTIKVADNQLLVHALNISSFNDLNIMDAKIKEIIKI